MTVFTSNSIVALGTGYLGFSPNYRPFFPRPRADVMSTAVK